MAASLAKSAPLWGCSHPSTSRSQALRQALQVEVAGWRGGPRRHLGGGGCGQPLLCLKKPSQRRHGAQKEAHLRAEQPWQAPGAARLAGSPRSSELPRPESINRRLCQEKAQLVNRSAFHEATCCVYRPGAEVDNSPSPPHTHTCGPVRPPSAPELGTWLGSPPNPAQPFQSLLRCLSPSSGQSPRIKDLLNQLRNQGTAVHRQNRLLLRKKSSNGFQVFSGKQWKQLGLPKFLVLRGGLGGEGNQVPPSLAPQHLRCSHVILEK